jgi:hypothetical protein
MSPMPGSGWNTTTGGLKGSASLSRSVRKGLSGLDIGRLFPWLGFDTTCGRVRQQVLGDYGTSMCVQELCHLSRLVEHGKEPLKIL